MGQGYDDSKHDRLVVGAMITIGLLAAAGTLAAPVMLMFQGSEKEVSLFGHSPAMPLHGNRPAVTAPPLPKP